MSDSSDLLEIEIAFSAFAQIMIDRLLAAKVATGEQISEPLKIQACSLREAGIFQAAHQLERLAAFSVQRANDLFLLEEPGEGGRQ
ncbi:MAG: hypothetical protein PHF20_02895 [Halothiobacillaceae bacterium]|nr:hypothetical protein [Halothiobacillaceae bacterium]